MVQVIDQTGGWDGDLRIRQTVERIIQSLPPEHSAGLESVVISTHGLQPSSRRREKTWARGRKVAISDCAGLYHRASRGQQAWIELFADSMTPPRTPGWLLRRRPIQNAIVGWVFFHELGHHLHATRAPEHREREDVADRWSARLLVPYLKREHSWFQPLMFLLRSSGLLRVIRSQLNRYAAHRAA